MSSYLITKNSIIEIETDVLNKSYRHNITYEAAKLAIDNGTIDNLPLAPLRTLTYAIKGENSNATQKGIQ